MEKEKEKQKEKEDGLESQQPKSLPRPVKANERLGKDFFERLCHEVCYLSFNM